MPTLLLPCLAFSRPDLTCLALRYRAFRVALPLPFLSVIKTLIKALINALINVLIYALINVLINVLIYALINVLINV